MCVITVRCSVIIRTFTRVYVSTADLTLKKFFFTISPVSGYMKTKKRHFTLFCIKIAWNALLHPWFFWPLCKSSSGLHPEHSERSQTSCWLCLAAVPLLGLTGWQEGDGSWSTHYLITVAWHWVLFLTALQACHHTLTQSRYITQLITTTAKKQKILWNKHVF